MAKTLLAFLLALAGCGCAGDAPAMMLDDMADPPPDMTTPPDLHRRYDFAKQPEPDLLPESDLLICADRLGACGPQNNGIACCGGISCTGGLCCDDVRQPCVLDIDCCHGPQGQKRFCVVCTNGGRQCVDDNGCP